MIKEYPEIHQKGILTIEQLPDKNLTYCDLGIMISSDGRIWLCVDGVAFIRFKPMDKDIFEAMIKHA